MGGNTYNVYYDYSHRGYGYWMGSTWMAYDAIRDAAMLGVLMDRHDYGVDTYSTPYYNPPHYSTRSYHSGGGFFSGLLTVLFIVVVAIVISRIFRAY